MQIPQIRIDQQFARVGMQTDHGNMSIRQGNADMQVNQHNAEMRFDIQHARVEIDQTRAFAEANLKKPDAFTREFAQRGEQTALQAIGRIASDGDRMSDIHIPQNPIPQFAARGKTDMPRTNITYIPSYGAVDIRYIPGRTDTNFQVRQADINVNKNEPQIQHTRARVNIFIDQQNYINISV